MPRSDRRPPTGSGRPRRPAGGKPSGTRDARRAPGNPPASGAARKKDARKAFGAPGSGRPRRPAGGKPSGTRDARRTPGNPRPAPGAAPEKAPRKAFEAPGGSARFAAKKPGVPNKPAGRPRGDASDYPRPPRAGKPPARTTNRPRPADGNPLAAFTKTSPGGPPATPPTGSNRGDKRSFVKSRLHKQRTPPTETSPTETSRTPKGDGLIRLNKFIANSGVCSRREADNLIAMGLVTVNGTTVTEMGHKVKPTDEVRYEGKRLKAEKPVYILLNKPKGFLTTTDDPQERHTVMNLVAGACQERVYPVGRLDRNTTGLLLLTNDGDLADKLTHPSYNVKKIYKAELDKPITKADFEKIAAGVQLEEGRAVPDDLAIVSDDKMTVGIELHVGWNRIVRRIFESLGYEVVKLDRVVYAGLDKKDLPRGNWRMLKAAEVVRLKHLQ